MAAPLQKEEYPKYFKTPKRLLAFVAPDRMYKIEAIGSNTNPGVTIDHYITRKMVLSHYPRGTGYEVTSSEFEELLKRLFDAYIDKIVNCK